MTYIELINEYLPKLKQHNQTKNILLQLIYHFDNQINDLSSLMNYFYEEIDNELLIKIKSAIDSYLNEDKPLAYIINQVAFCDLTFIVNEGVLIPRDETQLLVETIIDILTEYHQNQIIDLNQIKLLDLCCGSGCIGLSIISKLNMIDLTLSDIDTNAIKNTTINMNKLNLEAKIIQSDLFNHIKDKFNVIVFNPPYISENEILEPSVLKYEPYGALFAKNNGLFYYQAIILQIKSYLDDQFLVVMEIGYNQANDICSLIRNYLKLEPKVIKDNLNQDRIIIINHLDKYDQIKK